MIATVTLGGAFGSAVTGLIMSLIGAGAAFILLILASLLLLYPTALLWSAGVRHVKLDLFRVLKSLDPRGRSRDFWYASLIMALNSLARYPLTSFVLPIFMSELLGYDYMFIGIIFMGFNIISSITIFGTLKLSLSIMRAVIQSIIYLVTCISLPYFPSFMPVLVITLAIAGGLGTRFYESIIAKVSKDRHETLSIDIGILHIPLRIIEFTSLILFGLLIEKFGYPIAFTISGISYVAFSIFSYLRLR